MKRMLETEENEESYFSLSLRFFHPDFNPDEISESLKMTPRTSWQAGMRAKSPKGTELNFVRKQSYWCSEIIDGDGKDFPHEINRIIDTLLAHKEFLHQIVFEGGRVNLYLHLPGSVNIGNTLDVEILSKLADLKIDLDIEVFPHMKR